jgi:DNA-binding NarL/FixJ family response regulator
MAAKPRRRGIVLNHFFRISSPARIVADLSVRVHNDLNCGTWDYEIQPATRLSESGLNLDKGGSLDTSSSQVARRIRKLSRRSRILFVSRETSTDVVQAAFATGADGYVVKTDAGSELLEAVDSVLRGGQFVSRRFSDHDFVGASDAEVSQEFRTKSAIAPLRQNTEITTATMWGSILTMHVC